MTMSASSAKRTTSEGCRKPFTITPSDTADCTPTRGLHANTTGYIRVTGTDDAGDAYTDLYVIAGVVYPYWVRRVWATVLSGTAADVKGLL